jgi:hypothetical protein
MMAAHSSLDDVRNWPIFPRLSPVGLAYGLGKVATNDRISRSTSSCFDANMYTFAPTRSTSELDAPHRPQAYARYRELCIPPDFRYPFNDK